MGALDKKCASHREFAESYFENLTTVMRAVDLVAVGAMIEAFLEARRAGRTIYFIGNGGKAALSDEWANDLITCFPEKPFKAVSLCANGPLLTGIAHNFGFDAMFSTQVGVFGQRDDVLVALSGSGNSGNVLAGVVRAKSLNMVTVGMTGSDGGVLRTLVDISVHMETEPEDGPIEDVFLALLHMTVNRVKRL